MDLPRIFNVATWFVDRNVREGRGRNIAIECGYSKISYDDLLSHVNKPWQKTIEVTGGYVRLRAELKTKSKWPASVLCLPERSTVKIAIE